uniref:Putative secreted protein n=1 Tax=Amblyomma triste TaxID=251400 RepID=A0A023G1N2_AMBTT
MHGHPLLYMFSLAIPAVALVPFRSFEQPRSTVRHIPNRQTSRAFSMSCTLVFGRSRVNGTPVAAVALSLGSRFRVQHLDHLGLDENGNYGENHINQHQAGTESTFHMEP